MAPLRKPQLTIRNHFPFSLSAFEDRDPLVTLTRVLPLLQPLNLKHYLSAGTALGIHRDGRFIPHDTDIDLAVELTEDADSYQVATELVRTLSQNNMPLVRSIVADDQPVQLVFVDLKNRSLLVDIEFYYEGITDGAVVHMKPEGTITLPRQGVGMYPFGGIEVPMPKPIDTYLRDRYGDWQTPTKEKGDWQNYTSAFKSWEAQR